GLVETVELAKSAYPKSGGVVNGNVDATGSISGRGVYEYPSIRVYSAVNKPSPGELGAYTTGDCDRRFQLKGNYAPVGQSYTKSESDVRYGSKNTALKSTNGWWKCGDTGLIYQWGRNDVAGWGKIKITFPVPFPNQCINMHVSVRASSIPSDNYSTVYSFDKFEAEIGKDQLGSFWFAIGF
ncbi:hypothetical protein V2H77_01210, partial [Photorhabdus sp. P32]|uniref:gp53-like domain-containing protein n=1 Tax=Photorhabdus sp. P32 TaxID=3117549 RepID=UPI00327F502A